MNGGTYVCDNCGYSMAHFTSEDADNRLACLNCTGWMHPVEQEPPTHKKPGIIWFFLKPISKWLDRHNRSDENE